jgi:hypothetical protein
MSEVLQPEVTILEENEHNEQNQARRKAQMTPKRACLGCKRMFAVATLRRHDGERCSKCLDILLLRKSGGPYNIEQSAKQIAAQQSYSYRRLLKEREVAELTRESISLLYFDSAVSLLEDSKKQEYHSSKKLKSSNVVNPAQGCGGKLVALETLLNDSDSD